MKYKYISVRGGVVCTVRGEVVCTVRGRSVCWGRGEERGECSVKCCQHFSLSFSDGSTAIVHYIERGRLQLDHLYM